MKLYDSMLSPYSARVRLQLYFKGIGIELVAVPQGGSHAAEYARMNPLERIPTLDDTGFFLPESSAIGEYIEDTHPTPSLRPSDLKERARMRVIFNIGDQYLLNPLFDLFKQADPKVRDPKLADEKMTELHKALAGLEHFISGKKYALGDTASLADCSLVPVLFFISAIGPMFGNADLLAGTPKVKAYFAAVQADPAVARIMQELATALSDFMKRT